VFLNVGSAIPSTHYGTTFVSERSATSPRELHQAARRLAALPSEKGDGQENRRLFAFSFRFLNRPSEKLAQCAQECAQTGVPKTNMRRRYKARLWLHLAPKATV